MFKNWQPQQRGNNGETRSQTAARVMEQMNAGLIESARKKLKAGQAAELTQDESEALQKMCLAVESYHEVQVWQQTSFFDLLG